MCLKVFICNVQPGVFILTGIIFGSDWISEGPGEDI